MTKKPSIQGMWSTRFTFVLAVTGSAVGLGNIWKFPYIAGENGGGAFVLVYLVCVFAIGLPVMMSEILIGRRGRRNPVTTMARLGEEEAGNSAWKLVGGLGILAGGLILSFYSVIGGWALAYIFKSASLSFVGATPDAISAQFGAFQDNWKVQIMWHAIFMIMTITVVARGVRKGLESAVRFLMPSLLVLLLMLLVYAMTRGSFVEALQFMFTPRWDKLSFDGVIVAMGHAFFTLSVGMGAIMAYGAYLPEDASIGSTSVAVVVGDTGIALLSGLVIFSIVFANNLDPSGGQGLIFTTLPVAFSAMKGGVIFGTMFFLLMVFAAWTSALGLLEPAVAWLTERQGMSRVKAAIALGGTIFLLGLLTVLSPNVLANVRFARGTLFDNIDFLASSIMLPLCGFFIVIFAGWVMCRNSSSEELAIGTGLRFNLWRLLSRFIAPAAILFIFAKKMHEAFG
ncbi:MAG: sodium-dependent transporter [Gammaproteobacteria bacterium]